MLQFLSFGLNAVLPMELFPIFTPLELERMFCGSREIDIELLRECTEYEDVDPQAPHVIAFWEVLQELSQEERAQFLKFVGNLRSFAWIHIRSSHMNSFGPAHLHVFFSPRFTRCWTVLCTWAAR